MRDLEVVLALAEAGSTSSAASRLHLTQSAVSRALSNAEDKLGARLFERTARGLTPTTVGARLIGGAPLVLAQLVELERTARGDAAPERLRLVCECYTAYRWLPSTLAHLHDALPALEVTLAVEHTRAPVDALRAGEIDVAFLTTAAVPRRAGIEARALFEDEIVFVVAISHPLARKKAIALEDLESHPMIASETPPGESRWFAKAVFGRRRPRLTMLRFPLTEAVIDAARAGMGIAVMSEWIASSYLGAGDLVVKRLAKGPLRRPWRIAYRSEAREAASILAGAIESAAPRLRAAG